MRVTCHPEHAVVVLSLWSDDGSVSTCVSTFRLSLDQVPSLVHQLTTGLVSMVGSSPPDAADCQVAVASTAPPEAGGGKPAVSGTRARVAASLSRVADLCARAGDRLADGGR